jgi:hypothetical protein
MRAHHAAAEASRLRGDQPKPSLKVTSARPHFQDLHMDSTKGPQSRSREADVLLVRRGMSARREQ